MSDTEPAISDALQKHFWDKRSDILYRAELSTLYHRKRENFFTLLDKWDKIFTLLFGSIAFFKIVNLDQHPLWALPFAILSLSSLIFDFSENSRKHGELATKFKLLEAAIEKVGEWNFNQDNLSEWSARIREIESWEPTAYTLLVRLCQNELANAKGIAGDISKIPFYKAWLAHLIPFSNQKITFNPPN